MNNVIARNKVRVFGEGKRTIVMAHGFGCDQTMWQYISPAFSGDYRLVQFDYVGSGNSDLSAYSAERYGTFRGYVQDLLDVIEALELTEIIFFGHSVSSMIGMLASIERPELFSCMVMIGPSPRYLNDGEYFGGFERSDITELLDMMEMNFSGWASFMAPLAMNTPEHPELVKDLERSFITADPVITREFAEVTFLSDHRNAVAEASTPTLILQCSDDSIVPIQVGEYLHKNLRGSEFRLMKAKGHYPHISHPEETVALIKAYLQHIG